MKNIVILLVIFLFSPASFSADVGVQLKTKSTNEEIIDVFDQAVHLLGSNAAGSNSTHSAVKGPNLATVAISGKRNNRLVTVQVTKVDNIFGFFGENPQSFLDNIVLKMKERIDDLEVVPMNQ